MIKRDKLILLVTAALSVAGFVVLVFIVVFRSSSTPAKQQEPITEVNRPADSIINYESGTQSRLFKLLTEERSLWETVFKARGKITSSLPNSLLNCSFCAFMSLNILSFSIFNFKISSITIIIKLNIGSSLRLN